MKPKRIPMNEDVYTVRSALSHLPGHEREMGAAALQRILNFYESAGAMNKLRQHEIEKNLQVAMNAAISAGFANINAKMTDTMSGFAALIQHMRDEVQDRNYLKQLPPPAKVKRRKTRRKARRK